MPRLIRHRRQPERFARPVCSVQSELIALSWHANDMDGPRPGWLAVIVVTDVVRATGGGSGFIFAQRGEPDRQRQGPQADQEPPRPIFRNDRRQHWDLEPRGSRASVLDCAS